MNNAWFPDCGAISHLRPQPVVVPGGKSVSLNSWIPGFPSGPGAS